VFIGDVYQGARTNFALKAIQEANYQTTFQALGARLLNLLEDDGTNKNR